MKTWKARLQTVYSSFEEFNSYCEMWGNHIRLGYKTVKGAWNSNPMIQGSCQPCDYKVVKPKKH